MTAPIFFWKDHCSIYIYGVVSVYNRTTLNSHDQLIFFRVLNTVTAPILLKDRCSIYTVSSPFTIVCHGWTPLENRGT
jgi:hypothetical protein